MGRPPRMSVGLRSIYTMAPKMIRRVPMMYLSVASDIYIYLKGLSMRQILNFLSLLARDEMK